MYMKPAVIIMYTFYTKSKCVTNMEIHVHVIAIQERIPLFGSD